MASYFDEHDIPDPTAPSPSIQSTATSANPEQHPPASNAIPVPLPQNRNNNQNRQQQQDVLRDFLDPTSPNTQSQQPPSILPTEPSTQQLMFTANLFDSIRQRLTSPAYASTSPTRSNHLQVLESLITQLTISASMNTPQKPKYPPTSRKFIAQIETIDITPSTKSETCCICLNDFANFLVGKKLNCGHVFHSGCLLPWLECTNRCPLCRCVLPSVLDDEKEHEEELAKRRRERLDAGLEDDLGDLDNDNNNEDEEEEWDPMFG